MTSNFEPLKASLRNVLAETSFDLGWVLSEDPWGRTRRYANRPEDVVGPRALREMLVGVSAGDHDARHVGSARASIPGALKSDLEDTLRRALADNHDPASDCVGHAFPMDGDRGGRSTLRPSGISAEYQVSSIDSFSAMITKWAAICGVDSVVDLLAAWTRGDPSAYRTCVIVGLTLQQPLRPVEGVRITPLPLSTAELPSGLPSRDRMRRGAEYLGHAVLSVDTFATPALFRPVSNQRAVVQANLVHDLDFDLVLQALSLECDASIETGLSWNDYGKLSVLTTNRGTWSGVRGLGRPVGYRSARATHSTGETIIELHEGAAQNPSETAIQGLLRELKGADARTRVAVTRWKASKRPQASLTDRFIDLRIALESLFLPQTPDQQLKFRLAANGAWLVGRDAKDRRKTWDILRAAYDAASKAVHSGHVKRKGKNSELLADAQGVCRRGILRVLRDGPVTDWDGLILDASTQSPR